MSDWQRHYLETLGNVPPVIEAMYEADEGFGDGYTRIREALYAERPEGLDLATKELIYVVLDVVLENVGGATNHLQAAYAAGLTDTQLKEALMIVFGMCGIHSWGKAGARVWQAREEAKATAAARG